MADKNSLLQYVARQVGQEQLKQMVDSVQMELSQDPEVMRDGLEGIQELINQLNYVAENPEAYKDVVTSAIQSGYIDPTDVPPQFDPIFVAVMLLALEELKARFSSNGYKRGGLAQAAKQLAAKGRGGDTILAHINPREAEVLRRMGGSGTINPMTGLPEFKGGVVKAVTKVVKSVAKAVVPVVATVIGGPVAGAAAGAAMGALGGGGVKGAILGGVTGSLVPGGFLGNVAKTVGTGLTSVLPSSIGSMVTNAISPATLGAGVLGGLASSVAGQGFIPGALTAGGMAAATPTIQGLYSKATAPGGIFSNQAAGTGVNLAQPTGAPTTGGPGINLTQFQPGAAIKDTAGNLLTDVTAAPAANIGQVAAPLAAEAAKSSGLFGTGISGGQALAGLTLLNSLGGMTMPQAQLAISQDTALTPEQKEALTRELTNYTAQWNMATLPSSGTPEYDDMMNKIQQGIGITFMSPTISETPAATPAMAKGGPLTQISRLARGSGHGRSDTINARLSDGEYVIDAETVALLGNGSTKAGAAALDNMREALRKQKGKSLVKGKFSPDAKSPLAYLAGVK